MIGVAGVGAIVGIAGVEADVPIGAVIPEVAAVPVATVEAYAEEAEAVVDAAVVTHDGAPVSGVPEVAVGVIAPVAWGPQGPCVGGSTHGPCILLVAVAGRRMPSSRGSRCSRRRGPGAGRSQGWRAGLAGHPEVRRTVVRPAGGVTVLRQCCSRRTGLA